MNAKDPARPMLVLEVNEIAWRFLDRFLGHKKLPCLTDFFSRAECFTTISEDTGELSPWITWPSFHRGMTNTEHGIEFLGQDPKSFRGTPIWEEYRKLGYSIGIAGSLQSWPPIEPGKSGFYIPDTFAKDERCIPVWVEPVQKFNLQQTGANVRVVNARSLFSMDSVALAMRLPKLGIRGKTFLAIAKQLLGERIFRERLARRPVFQALLFWDIFLRLFDQQEIPLFSTFFTNHVASAMHRYWHHVFPEDFSEKSDQKHFDTVLFAMESLEMILRESLELQKKHPDLLLVFATSMGQGAKEWKKFNGYAFSIPDLTPLMHICELEKKDFTHLLAMTPQVCAEIPNTSLLKKVMLDLEGAKTSTGEKVFVLKEQDNRLTISTPTASVKDIEAGFFWLKDKKLSWEAAGIKVSKVEMTSGYHIPEGILAILGKDISADSSRKSIPAKFAKKLLLERAGIQL